MYDVCNMYSHVRGVNNLFISKELVAQLGCDINTGSLILRQAAPSCTKVYVLEKKNQYILNVI